MTLALVIASRNSIWSCTDRQLTERASARRSGPMGVKVLAIETDDGYALLTYAGIGRVSDTEVSRWAYRTLVGTRMPLERSLEFLSDAAQRRLAPYARRFGASHFFIASAIRGGEHLIFSISLSQRPPMVIRHPPRSANDILAEAAGTGRKYLLQFERQRLIQLKRLVKRYDRGDVSTQFLATQLAALNIAVSARARSQPVPDRSISLESVVIYQDRSEKRAGGANWIFDAAGHVDTGSSVVVPSVARGFPATDIAERYFKAWKKHFPPGERFNAERATAAHEEAVRMIQTEVSDQSDDEFH